MNNNSQLLANKNKNALGFGISKKQLEEIRENIRNKNITFLKENVLSLHHADIADIFEIYAALLLFKVNYT